MIPTCVSTQTSLPDVYEDVRFFGAVGGDAEKDSAAFRQAFSAADSQGCKVLIPPSPSGEPYLVGGLVTPRQTAWEFQGGRVVPRRDVVIHGAIEGPAKPLFIDIAESSSDASPLKIRSETRPDEISQVQGNMLPHWFLGTSKDVQEWGHRANLVFQIGGTKSVADFLSGYYPMSESIRMDSDYYGSHLRLKGASFQSTHLQSFGDVEIALIDMTRSDESQVSDLKANEQQGRRACICIAVGGTSSKVTNCFFGNSKYGIYQSSGAGSILENNYVEGCLYNRYISVGKASDVAGFNHIGGSIRDVRESLNMYHTATRASVRVERLGVSNTLQGLSMGQMSVKGANNSQDGLVVASDNVDALSGLVVLGSNFNIDSGRPIAVHNTKLQVGLSNIIDSGTGVAVTASGRSEVMLSSNNIRSSNSSQTVEPFTTAGRAIVNESGTIS